MANKLIYLLSLHFGAFWFVGLFFFVVLFFERTQMEIFTAFFSLAACGKLCPASQGKYKGLSTRHRVNIGSRLLET